MDQEHSSERRGGLDRRQSVVDRRLGLDRRRGPGRRLSEERRSAEDGRMSEDQLELLMAIEEYKRLNARPFPTWTEVLEIIKALGYRKVARPLSTPPVAQTLRERQEDTEIPDPAPSTKD